MRRPVRGLPSQDLVLAFPPEGMLGCFRASVGAAYLGGRVEEAIRLGLASARTAHALGDPATEASCRLITGFALARAQLLPAVRRQAEIVIALTRAMEGIEHLPRHATFWRAHALSMLADAAVEEGRMLPAIDHLAEALALVEEFDPDSAEEMMALLAISNVLSRLMLFEPACDLIRKAERAIGRGRSAVPPALLAALAVLPTRILTETHLLWGLHLDLLGRGGEAAHAYALAATSAQRMEHTAAAIDDPAGVGVARLLQGAAVITLRGQVSAWAGSNAGPPVTVAPEGLLCEAVLLQRGVEDLAVPALAGHGGRDDLVVRLVVARVLAGLGRRDRGRSLLLAAAQPQLAGTRVTAETLEVVLAEIEGGRDHPAAVHWRELANAAMERLWEERESRFLNLRQRVLRRRLLWRRERTERELVRDPLTGLGNRRLLTQELDRAVTGVLFIDVDRFKAINDELSHEVGDLVLRRIAAILRSSCRATDILIRYGGDEFVVLLTEGAPAGALGARVLERVRTEDWAALTGGPRVTVSVGAADAASLRDALSRSDAALLAAKESGRDGLVEMMSGA